MNKSKLLWSVAYLCVVILLFSIPAHSDNVHCNSTCHSDKDCQQSFFNPCTFCLRKDVNDKAGVCSTMCGIGCGSDADCGGGSNPCQYCDPTTRTCVDPRPSCGGWCDNDIACHANGTSKICAGFLTHQSCCHCINNTCASGGHNSTCGKVCSGQFACGSNSDCPECVGFYCTTKGHTCGQVCISAGQCQSNPNECKACIGATCENLHGCGESCGGDSWCSSSCPVCGYAKCVSSEEWERQLSLNAVNRTAFIQKAAKARLEVRQQSLLKAKVPLEMNGMEWTNIYNALLAEDL